MTQRAELDALPRTGAAAGWTTTAAAIGALDVVLVGALLLLDRVHVQSQQALDSVALGMPLNWIDQTQTITPPLPWQARFLSPWDNPTAVAWLPLVLDLAICGVLLAAIWAGVRTWRTRRRSVGPQRSRR